MAENTASSQKVSSFADAQDKRSDIVGIAPVYTYIYIPISRMIYVREAVSLLSLGQTQHVDKTNLY